MARNVKSSTREMYGVVSGVLDSGACTRILTGFSAASQNNVKKMHVLFQSTGGDAAQGICLYNFFKNLSLDLTLYNTGVVSSTAVVAFLGAKRRRVSKHATFMIHRTQGAPQAANPGASEAFADSAALFAKNTEAILREHIKMPENRWDYFKHNDVSFTAEQAVKYDLAQEIADFSPPSGAKIWTF